MEGSPEIFLLLFQSPPGVFLSMPKAVLALEVFIHAAGYSVVKTRSDYLPRVYSVEGDRPDWRFHTREIFADRPRKGLS